MINEPKAKQKISQTLGDIAAGTCSSSFVSKKKKKNELLSKNVPNNEDLYIDNTNSLEIYTNLNLF